MIALRIYLSGEIRSWSGCHCSLTRTLLFILLLILFSVIFGGGPRCTGFTIIFFIGLLYFHIIIFLELISFHIILSLLSIVFNISLFPVSISFRILYFLVPTGFHIILSFGATGFHVTLWSVSTSSPIATKTGAICYRILPEPG